MEDVLASLDHVESTTGNKRKKPLALEKEELIKHSPKRLRSNELDSFGAQSVGDTPIHQAQHCAVSTVSNGQHVTPKTDGEKVNGYHLDIVCPAAGTTGWESLQDNDAAEPDNPACTEDFSPLAHLASAGHLLSSSKVLLTTDVDELVFAPHCGALGILEEEDDSRQVESHPEVLNRQNRLTCSQSEGTEWTEQKSLTASITTCKAISGVKLETEDLSCNSEELVSAPNQLFWWNSDNLCWLDSLLIALVNCKSLKKSKPKDEPQQSSVWQLMRGYEDIYAAIQARQQTGRGTLQYWFIYNQRKVSNSFYLSLCYSFL